MEEGIREHSVLRFHPTQLTAVKSRTAERGITDVGSIQRCVDQLCSVEHRTFQIAVTEVEVTEQAVGEVSLFALGTVEPQQMLGTHDIHVALCQLTQFHVVLGSHVVRCKGDEDLPCFYIFLHVGNLRSLGEHLQEQIVDIRRILRCIVEGRQRHPKLAFDLSVHGSLGVVAHGAVDAVDKLGECQGLFHLEKFSGVGQVCGVHGSVAALGQYQDAVLTVFCHNEQASCDAVLVGTEALGLTSQHFVWDGEVLTEQSVFLIGQLHRLFDLADIGQHPRSCFLEGGVKNAHRHTSYIESVGL